MKHKILSKNFWLASKKKLQYGGLSAAMVLIALAAAVAFNLLVALIPHQADLTENKIFTFDPQTEALADSLTQPIEISYLIKEEDIGSAGSRAKIYETLQKYAQLSSHLSFQVINPDRNPAFVSMYRQNEENPSYGSIIVAGNNRFKTIPDSELISYSQRQGALPIPVSLNVESKLSAAVSYIATGLAPKLYALSGHGEISPGMLRSVQNFSLQERLSSENYLVENLILADKPMPEDANVLLILEPKTDLTAYEEQQIRAFLNNDGRLYVSLAFTGKPLPRLYAILEAYGIKVSSFAAAEGDTRQRIARESNNDYIFIPSFLPHPITAPLESGQALMAVNAPIILFPSSSLRRNLSIEPLLATSPEAQARELSGNSLQTNKSFSGPFNLAYAVSTRNTETGQNAQTGAKIVIISGDMTLAALGFAGSENFLVYACNWLADRGSAVSIPTKSLYELPLRMSPGAVYAFSIAFSIVLPLGIALCGLGVWLKRRHL